jgi:predicted ATPase/DNA-binding XRE family transcriptional regulator
MDSAGPVRALQRSFGAQLRYYRQTAGLSQEALAERARLSVQAVSAYEQGLRLAPYRETVALLAAALGLSPEEAAALEATIPRRRGPVTVDGTPTVTNLLPPLTSLIGREQALAEVTLLIDTTRLLTLTGPGGTGKTRLALEVAAGLLDHFPQGVWLVELAPLADPAGVPAAVAAAVGVREEAGQPVLTTLIAALRRRRLLLVLDNCEHLLDAGAALVEALLRGCPQVRLLATSREVLGIAGETVRRVPSLALPDGEHLPPEALAGFAAVRLFVERAQAVQPHFALTTQNASLVVQICRRLDGIPLALELAAARLSGLSIDALAARLDQRFRLLTGGSRTALPRQQTLQATVDWSYGLLTASEQTLFNRLAVFTGGFTLEAAEAVCAGGLIATEEVLALLLRLVDRSLVIGEEVGGNVERYRLLETLRQYGREHLVARGEAEALYARHFAHYRDLAERVLQMHLELQPTAQPDPLEAEHENLRQALGWALDLREAQDGLRLAGALWGYWWYRGSFGEGRRWLGALVALPGAAARTAARAQALYAQAMLQFGTGWLAGRFWQGSCERRELHEESLAIAREVGDEMKQARNLVFLGLVLVPTDSAAARAYLEEGLARATAQGDRWLDHIALVLFGTVAWAQGDYVAARRWCTHSIEHAQRDRNQNGYARALWMLAAMTFQEGDAAAARRGLEESLAVFRSLLDRMGMALVLGMLGVVAATHGDSAGARACFVEKRALWEQVGERSGIASAMRDLGWLARQKGETAQARVHYEEALGLERDLGDAAGIAASLAGLGDVACDQGDHAQATIHYADGLAKLAGSDTRNEHAACLEGLATVAWAGGDADRAARLWGAATAARMPDITITPASVTEAAEVITAARAALGEERFNSAWAAGQALTLEEATALALEGRAEG